MLREVEQRTHILQRLAGCFVDHRDPEQIEHSLESLIKQRVMGLALGYEDLNDHDSLRHDPLLALLSEVSEPLGQTRKRARDELMAWCEEHAVDFVLGLAKNPRLTTALASQMEQVL